MRALLQHRTGGRAHLAFNTTDMSAGHCCVIPTSSGPKIVTCCPLSAQGSWRFFTLTVSLVTFWLMMRYGVYSLYHLVVSQSCRLRRCCYLSQLDTVGDLASSFPLRCNGTGSGGGVGGRQSRRHTLTNGNQMQSGPHVVGIMRRASCGLFTTCLLTSHRPRRVSRERG